MKSKYKWLINGILCLMTLVWIAPVVFVLLNTLKGKQEYNLGSLWDLPKGSQLFENFKYIIDSKVIFDGMASSFLYAVLGAGGALIMAILAAYAIAHLRIKHPMFWFLFTIRVVTSPLRRSIKAVKSDTRFSACRPYHTAAVKSS